MTSPHPHGGHQRLRTFFQSTMHALLLPGPLCALQFHCYLMGVCVLCALRKVVALTTLPHPYSGHQRLRNPPSTLLVITVKFTCIYLFPSAPSPASTFDEAEGKVVSQPPALADLFADPLRNVTASMTCSHSRAVPQSWKTASKRSSMADM